MDGIFSGVGSAIVKWVLDLFKREQARPSVAVTQRQSGGDHSSNVQIGIQHESPQNRPAGHG
jgi:hypothetical protein